MVHARRQPPLGARRVHRRRASADAAAESVKDRGVDLLPLGRDVDGDGADDFSSSPAAKCNSDPSRRRRRVISESADVRRGDARLRVVAVAADGTFVAFGVTETDGNPAAIEIDLKDGSTRRAVTRGANCLDDAGRDGASRGGRLAMPRASRAAQRRTPRTYQKFWRIKEVQRRCSNSRRNSATSPPPRRRRWNHQRMLEDAKPDAAAADKYGVRSLQGRARSSSSIPTAAKQAAFACLIVAHRRAGWGVLGGGVATHAVDGSDVRRIPFRGRAADTTTTRPRTSSNASPSRTASSRTAAPNERVRPDEHGAPVRAWITGAEANARC